MLVFNIHFAVYINIQIVQIYFRPACESPFVETVGCNLDTGSRLFHSPLLSLVFQNVNEKSDCPKSIELDIHLKASYV